MQGDTLEINSINFDELVSIDLDNLKQMNDAEAKEKERTGGMNKYTNRVVNRY
jgi:hypothetical protein